MTDEQKVQEPIKQRPADPTTSGEDFLGDTTGMTGVTTGSAAATSSTPNDNVKDENKTHLPGGIQKGVQNTENISQIPEGMTNTDDEAYNKAVFQGMSDTNVKVGNDIASEPSDNDMPDPSVATPPTTGPELTTGEWNTKESSGDDSPNSDEINTDQAPYQQPHNVGEQDAVGGTESDPNTDDDVGEMAQRAGFKQNDDGVSDPEELDTAGELDDAEQKIRTS